MMICSQDSSAKSTRTGDPYRGPARDGASRASRQ